MLTPNCWKGLSGDCSSTRVLAPDNWMVAWNTTNEIAALVYIAVDKVFDTFISSNISNLFTVPLVKREKKICSVYRHIFPKSTIIKQVLIQPVWYSSKKLNFKFNPSNIARIALTGFGYYDGIGNVRRLRKQIPKYTLLIYYTVIDESMSRTMLFTAFIKHKQTPS